jgi:carbon monoxide dehydrogenase subunit G
LSAPADEFGGEETFRAKPAALFAQLTDLEALARTIPDLVSAEKVDERTMKCVVRPGFSFLRGTMKLEIQFLDLVPNESATMSVTTHGIGLSMRVLSHLQVAELGEGSRLTWQAQIVERKGLIAAVSSSLIRAAADQVIRHAWASVRTQLGE